MPRFVVCLLLMLAGAAQARTLDVGANQPFATPSAAAAVARDGDRIAIHPGVYVDCAVWNAHKLTIEGVGDAGSVTIADKTCQGKALFVTVGDGIAIRNLTLTGARVADGNGAGIRAEGQNLTVDGVRFIGNQDGILTGTVGGSLTVRNSLFARNGACLAACAHGIYAGRLDSVRVENSHFIDTREGHHIKSRARQTDIIGCTIEDGPNGTASYEIDLPHGGGLLARGNTITKGPKSGNHGTVVSLGAEGALWPSAVILIEDNVVRSEGHWNTYFVANLSPAPAILRGNTLTGSIKPLRGEGTVR